MSKLWYRAVNAVWAVLVWATLFHVTNNKSQTNIINLFWYCTLLKSQTSQRSSCIMGTPLCRQK